MSSAHSVAISNVASSPTAWRAIRTAFLRLWLLPLRNQRFDCGALLYDAEARTSGFALLAATVAASLIMLTLARESHCRQAG